MPASRDWDAPLDVRVKIDGVDLPACAYRDLREVTVQEDVEAPSMITLKLSTWNEDKRQISWADDDVFSLGGEVEVSLGYSGALRPLMKAEITGLELEMVRAETPELVVRCYDRRHRLLRGTKTRSFVKMSDSEIASQIARESGLRVKATDSKVKHEYVLQHGQPDLVFLSRRADAIGYEVVVEDKTLIFRPHQSGGRASITLSLDDDVIEFSPRLSARGQAGNVRVLGWDPKKKAAFVGKAISGDQTAMGVDFGTRTADKVFGAATVDTTDRAVATRAEADKVARGIMANMGLGYIQAEGTTYGRTDLHAGVVAEIQGAGKRFSGRYYMTTVTHSYVAKKAYRTTFTARRNAT